MIVNTARENTHPLFMHSAFVTCHGVRAELIVLHDSDILVCVLKRNQFWWVPACEVTLNSNLHSYLPEAILMWLILLLDGILWCIYMSHAYTNMRHGLYLYKLARVIPVPKSEASRNSVTGYCPISILSPGSKVLKCHVTNIILDHYYYLWTLPNIRPLMGLHAPLIIY